MQLPVWFNGASQKSPSGRSPFVNQSKFRFFPSREQATFLHFGKNLFFVGANWRLVTDSVLFITLYFAQTEVLATDIQPSGK